MITFSGLAYIYSFASNQIIKQLKNAIIENRNKQEQLIEMAHFAGQTDVATSTLYNIKNILNSVMISAENIGDTQKKASLTGLSEANTLLMENIDNIDDFIEHNPKGKQLMDYYLQIEKNIQTDQENNTKQLQLMQEKLKDISNIIKGQEKFLHKQTFVQGINIIENIKDVLTMSEEKFSAQKINIITHFEKIPDIPIQKAKLVNIIYNI
ncbi:MAG: hypothetical protein GY870_05425, partial [archaeon]|nr:hypothetical protein [archaeon]